MGHRLGRHTERASRDRWTVAIAARESGGAQGGREVRMNLSELFVRRPVATSLLTAGLACFGALAYLTLPVSDLPAVDFPTITVSASLPGASPETMAAAVATPLEKQLSTIASIDSMSSTS